MFSKVVKSKLILIISTVVLLLSSFLVAVNLKDKKEVYSSYNEYSEERGYAILKNGTNEEMGEDETFTAYGNSQFKFERVDGGLNLKLTHTYNGNEDTYTFVPTKGNKLSDVVISSDNKDNKNNRVRVYYTYPEYLISGKYNPNVNTASVVEAYIINGGVDGAKTSIKGDGTSFSFTPAEIDPSYTGKLFLSATSIEQYFMTEGYAYDGTSTALADAKKTEFIYTKSKTESMPNPAAVGGKEFTSWILKEDSEHDAEGAHKIGNYIVTDTSSGEGGSLTLTIGENKNGKPENDKITFIYDKKRVIEGHICYYIESIIGNHAFSHVGGGDTTPNIVARYTTTFDFEIKNINPNEWKNSSNDSMQSVYVKGKEIEYGKSGSLPFKETDLNNEVGFQDSNAKSTETTFASKESCGASLGKNTYILYKYGFNIVDWGFSYKQTNAGADQFLQYNGRWDTATDPCTHDPDNLQATNLGELAQLLDDKLMFGSIMVYGNTINATYDWSGAKIIVKADAQDDPINNSSCNPITYGNNYKLNEPNDTTIGKSVPYYTTKYGASNYYVLKEGDWWYREIPSSKYVLGEDGNYTITLTPVEVENIYKVGIDAKGGSFDNEGIYTCQTATAAYLGNKFTSLDFVATSYSSYRGSDPNTNESSKIDAYMKLLAVDSNNDSDDGIDGGYITTEYIQYLDNTKILGYDTKLTSSSTGYNKVLDKFRKVFKDTSNNYHIYLFEGQEVWNGTESMLPYYTNTDKLLMAWINTKEWVISNEETGMGPDQLTHTYYKMDVGALDEDIIYNTKQCTANNKFSMENSNAEGGVKIVAFYFEEYYYLDLKTVDNLGNSGLFGYAIIRVKNVNSGIRSVAYILKYNGSQYELYPVKSTMDISKLEANPQICIKDYEDIVDKSGASLYKYNEEGTSYESNFRIWKDEIVYITAVDQSGDYLSVVTGNFDSMIGMKFDSTTTSSTNGGFEPVISDLNSLDSNCVATSATNKCKHCEFTNKYEVHANTNLEAKELVTATIKFVPIQYTLNYKIDVTEAGDFNLSITDGARYEKVTEKELTLTVQGGDLNITQTYNARLGYEYNTTTPYSWTYLVTGTQDTNAQTFNFVFNAAWLRTNFYVSGKAGADYNTDITDLDVITILTNTYAFDYEIWLNDTYNNEILAELNAKKFDDPDYNPYTFELIRDSNPDTTDGTTTVIGLDELYHYFGSEDIQLLKTMVFNASKEGYIIEYNGVKYAPLSSYWINLGSDAVIDSTQVNYMFPEIVLDKYATEINVNNDLLNSVFEGFVVEGYEHIDGKILAEDYRMVPIVVDIREILEVGVKVSMNNISYDTNDTERQVIADVPTLNPADENETTNYTLILDRSNPIEIDKTGSFSYSDTMIVYVYRGQEKISVVNTYSNRYEGYYLTTNPLLSGYDGSVVKVASDKNLFTINNNLDVTVEFKAKELALTISYTRNGETNAAWELDKHVSYGAPSPLSAVKYYRIDHKLENEPPVTFTFTIGKAYNLLSVTHYGQNVYITDTDPTDAKITRGFKIEPIDADYENNIISVVFDLTPVETDGVVAKYALMNSAQAREDDFGEIGIIMDDEDTGAESKFGTASYNIFVNSKVEIDVTDLAKGYEMVAIRYQGRDYTFSTEKSAFVDSSGNPKFTIKYQGGKTYILVANNFISGRDNGIYEVLLNKLTYNMALDLSTATLSDKKDVFTIATESNNGCSYDNVKYNNTNAIIGDKITLTANFRDRERLEGNFYYTNLSGDKVYCTSENGWEIKTDINKNIIVTGILTTDLVNLIENIDGHKLIFGFATSQYVSISVVFEDTLTDIINSTKYKLILGTEEVLTKGYLNDRTQTYVKAGSEIKVNIISPAYEKYLINTSGALVINNSYQVTDEVFNVETSDKALKITVKQRLFSVNVIDKGYTELESEAREYNINGVVATNVLYNEKSPDYQLAINGTSEVKDNPNENWILKFIEIEGNDISSIGKTQGNVYLDILRYDIVDKSYKIAVDDGSGNIKEWENVSKEDVNNHGIVIQPNGDNLLVYFMVKNNTTIKPYYNNIFNVTPIE